MDCDDIQDYDTNSNDGVSIERALYKAKIADKTYDKCRRTITIALPNKKEYTKKVVIERFGSKGQGSRIRDAISGIFYTHIIGSKDEDLYFKVHEMNAHNRKEPLVLFYSSPEEYEDHNFTKIGEIVKEKWREKCLSRRRNM